MQMRLSIGLLSVGALCLLGAAGAAGWRSGGTIELLNPVAHMSATYAGGSVLPSSPRARPDQVSADLFGRPAPAPAHPTRVLPLRARLTPPATPAADSDPVDRYRVTGIAELNGQRYVCLEERDTK